MARMIPDELTDDDFDSKSLEDKTFEKLSHLPDDYTVFHSIRISSSIEREIDFLIFHKDKGILCLESKAGKVKYRRQHWYNRNGEEEKPGWYYENDIKMKHCGPYNQVRDAMFELLDKLRDFQKQPVNKTDPLRKNLANVCLFQYGVCFPSISRQYFNTITLPPDADPKRTLTADELSPENIQAEIDKIFAHPTESEVKTQLDPIQVKVLLNEFLCPNFDTVPVPNVEKADRDNRFLRLLKEQASVLDFLVDQRSAAICGSAGTGKTLIALEQAKREAQSGEKVLFLCYNKFLKEDLDKRIHTMGLHKKIDVRTIDGYACSVCGTSEPDYKKLIGELGNMFDQNSFPYDHVVVDEAQDFGSLGKSDTYDVESDTYDVLEYIKMCLEQKPNGTFYLFYDPMQMVQAKELPSVIKDADCKLTLYKNCRNTRNIARTSLSLLPQNRKRTSYDINKSPHIEGNPPQLHFMDKQSALNSIPKILRNIQNDKTLEKIVILTCKTENTSFLTGKVQTDSSKRRSYRIGGIDILFTTCRKFKGLEADAVVLIDVDAQTFSNEEEKLRFYVGASRARFRLDIIAALSDEDIKAFLEKKAIAARSGRERMTFLNTINCTAN